ncbi:amino acid racemase [bacterium]|nr:amino acid racemase [bacterium]
MIEFDKSKIVGVIGGAGVAATNKLQELIEIYCTQNGAFRDCHHPEMIIWQATQVPSRSMYLEGKGESFIPGYIDIAKKLKECGANKICMCCNTAHYAIDEISQKAGIDFINLVEEVALEVASQKIEYVGLVASDGCLKGKVYEKSFSKICPNVKIIYPEEEYQHLVTKGICNVKTLHRFDDTGSNERPMNIFKQVKQHLKDKGAQKVIMGCTDIRNDYYDVDVIDSLEVLKNSIIKYCKI